MIFYFSGCGNSRFIAESLARELNETLVFIPDAERSEEYSYSLKDNEKVGFVFPIYSWMPPQLVSDFIAKLKFSQKPTYVYAAVTAGDNVGMTEEILRNQLLNIGLPLDAAFCFTMPNTYVNMAGMTVDSKEKALRKIEKTKAELPTVIAAIQSGQKVSTMIKGIFPRFKSYTIGKSFYKWVSDSPFHTTDDCTSCGLCSKVCPLHNISLENGRPHWNGHCTNCDACYHHCPTHAIHFGNKTKGKGQYFFGKYKA